MCLKLKDGGSEEFLFLHNKQSRTRPIYSKKNFVKKKFSEDIFLNEPNLVAFENLSSSLVGQFFLTQLTSHSAH